MKNQQEKQRSDLINFQQQEAQQLTELNNTPTPNNREDVSIASCTKNYSYLQDLSQLRDNTDRLLIDGMEKPTDRQINNRNFYDTYQKGDEDISFYKPNQEYFSQSIDINLYQKQKDDFYLSNEKDNIHIEENEKDASLQINPQEKEDRISNQPSYNYSLQKKCDINLQNTNLKVSDQSNDTQQPTKKSSLYNGQDKESIKLREPDKSLQEYVRKMKYAKLVAKKFKQNYQKRVCQREQNCNQSQINQEVIQIDKNKIVKKQNSVGSIQGIQIVDNFEKGISIILNILKLAKSRQAVTQQYLLQFLQKLKRQSKLRSLEDLSIQEYTLLRDTTHLLHQQKRHSSYFLKLIETILNLVYEICERLNSNIPILLPSQNFKLIWDFFQIIFSISFFFFYSVYAFFVQDSFMKSDSSQIQISHSEIVNIILFVAAFLFSSDIIINFNTAFYNKDQIKKNRREIAKKYLQSHFIFDLVSTLVIIVKLILENYHKNLFKSGLFIISYIENILIFSRSFSLQSKRKNLESSINLKQNQKYILKLIDLIFLTISFAHFVCILWNELAEFEDYFGFEITWRSKAQIPLDFWLKKYIYSIYWAVTTMSTVGYGDITPSNYIEALFTTINMLMMSCVFAYIINNVGMILQEIDKSSKELNHDIDTILRYLNRKSVNITLRSRVRYYLNFVAKEQKDLHKESEIKVLQKLSKKLRDEIAIEINEKIINKYSIFQKYFSKQTLDKIILALQEIHIQPNEVIFTEQELDDQAIYFLQSGQIEIFQNQQSSSKDSNQILLKLLNSSGLFGEISFFSGKVRTASARSLNLSTLYYIKRKDFIDILVQNSEDLERFKMIEHQINCLNNISCIGIECYLCKELGHIAQYCKRSHYIPDQQFQILKENFSFFQERKLHKRLQMSEKYSHAMSLIQHNKNLRENLLQRIKNFDEIIQENMVQNSQEEDQESQNEDEEEFEEENEDDDDEDISQTKNLEMRSHSSFTSQNKRISTNENTFQNQYQNEKGQRDSIFIKLSRPNEGQLPEILEYPDLLPKIQESKQRAISFDGKQEIKLESVQSPAFEPKAGDNSQLCIEDEIDLNNSTIKKDYKLAIKGDNKLAIDLSQTNQEKRMFIEDRKKLMQYQKSKSIDKKITSPRKRDSSIFSLRNRQSLDQLGLSTNLANSIIPHNSINMNSSNGINLAQHFIYASNQNASSSSNKDPFQLFSNNQINSSSRFSYYNQTSLVSQMERLLMPTTNNKTDSYNQDIEKKKFKDSTSDLNLVTKNSSNLSVLAQMPQTDQQLEKNQLQKKVLSILQAVLGKIQNQNTIQQLPNPDKNQKNNQLQYQTTNPSKFSLKEDAFSNYEHILSTQFDKMKNFKIYFTHNNPSKIIQDYRNKCYQTNKQKKMKGKQLPKERQRRGNILDNTDIMLKFSPYQILTSCFLEEKMIINKPTFLSYGVAQQLGQQYPKIYDDSQPKQINNKCSIYNS